MTIGGPDDGSRAPLPQPAPDLRPPRGRTVTTLDHPDECCVEDCPDPTAGVKTITVWLFPRAIEPRRVPMCWQHRRAQRGQTK